MPCGSVFALTEPALDRSHAPDSANSSFSLFRGVLHRAAYSFLCCKLPVHGMSRSTDTNITCFRVLSEIPVEICLNDSGIRMSSCLTMTQCVHCRTLISNVAKLEGVHVSDFCVHAWRLRSEYLENLGCHDPAFG